MGVHSAPGRAYSEYILTPYPASTVETTTAAEKIYEVMKDYIQQQNQRQQQRSGGTFPYFDIEKQAWRCFKVETLMDIDRGYTI